jgi:hypothetical protein
MSTSFLNVLFLLSEPPKISFQTDFIDSFLKIEIFQEFLEEHDMLPTRN